MYRLGILLSCLLFAIYGNPIHAQKGNGPQIFSESDSLNYIGLECSQDKIFILADLVRSYKKNYLLVLDENGKILASSGIPGNYTRLYHSCDNALYLGDKDSVRQVFVRSDTIFFGNAIETANFEASMKTYLFMADGVVFKRTEAPAKMSSLLYAIYKDEHEKTIENLVFEVQDSLAVKTYEMESVKRNKVNRTKRTVNRNSAKNNLPVDKQIEQLEKKNGLSPKNMVQRTPISPSAYHVLVKMLMEYHDENFYVLDYSNGSIACINRFLSERKMVDLEGFEASPFLCKILCDAATGDFCLVEKAGGRCVVKKYDHLSGKLVFSGIYPELIHSDEISVYNDRLYFLIRKIESEPTFLVKVIGL